MPSSREDVKEALESESFVDEVGDMHVALLAVTSDTTVSTFGAIVRNHGWAVVSVYERNGQRYITFAPFDEVMA